jgi:hypothetical protein|tara:strand:- start:314 stop:592 length:279 start_codon:yes stop_codon:yes gene_type:complete
VERNNLINNLFKSIIDLSFPNIVKYIFWACEEGTGVFEKLDFKEYNKFKTMSKYKKDEMTNKRKNKNGDEDMASSSEDEIKMEVPQGTNLDN